MLVTVCAGLLTVALDMAGAESPSADKDQALIVAAQRNDVVLARQLLKRGAGVQARNAQGRTALMAATYENHVEVAKLLIESGADVNAQDAMQNSPLLLAGASGYLDILRLTLKAHPDFKKAIRPLPSFFCLRGPVNNTTD